MGHPRNGRSKDTRNGKVNYPTQAKRRLEWGTRGTPAKAPAKAPGEAASGGEGRIWIGARRRAKSAAVV
jgi:hypothetical protein